VGLAEPGDALADDLAGPLDGLLSVREQLQRTARELEDEFARVLVRVGVEPAASEEHPGPPQDLPATPAPAAAPAPAPEELAFEGEIVLDAGPFHGIAGLCAFEQGLSQVASAESVHVTGFEGVRVLVELRLASSTALVRELRDALPVDFTVAEADADRLRVDIQPDPTAPAR
jgi:hypothetical protein